MNYVLQRNHLYSFLCIYITQTIAASIDELSLAKSSVEQERNDEQLITSMPITTSTSTRPSSSPNIQYRPHTFEFNLKIIGILLACIIFVFALIRLCVMVCNTSRASNRQSSHRRTSIVRPQIAIVEMSEFKPDLPPAYAEAVTNIDTDGSKLPSYEELRRREST